MPRTHSGDFGGSHTLMVASSRMVSAAWTVTLKSSATNQPWSASIRNAGGDVAVTGALVDRSGVTEATFDLRPAATAPVAVRNALSLLGPPDANGVVHVAWRNQR